MHDPMTVICDIKAPWFRRRPWPGSKSPKKRVHPTLVTIWHVDPETDGSDDSCDWFGKKLPPEAMKLAEEMADWEVKFPYLFVQPTQSFYRSEEDGGGYTITRIGPGDCLAVVLAIFIQAAWRLRKQARLTPKDIAAALYVSVNESDNFQMSLAETGSKFSERSPTAIRARRAATIARIIGCYLKTYRPWWRHPRWHLHHWKVQVHALLNFKRWAFSRCCLCGKRFRWGEAPVSGNWHGTGPLWFKSEKGVAHMACDRQAHADLVEGRIG